MKHSQCIWILLRDLTSYIAALDSKNSGTQEYLPVGLGDSMYVAACKKCVAFVIAWKTTELTPLNMLEYTFTYRYVPI